MHLLLRGLGDASIQDGITSYSDSVLSATVTFSIAAGHPSPRCSDHLELFCLNMESSSFSQTGFPSENPSDLHNHSLTHAQNWWIKTVNAYCCSGHRGQQRMVLGRGHFSALNNPLGLRSLHLVAPYSSRK